MGGCRICISRLSAPHPGCCPAPHPGCCSRVVICHRAFNRISVHSIHDPVCSPGQLHHNPAVAEPRRVPAVARHCGISTGLHLRQQFRGHLVGRGLRGDNRRRWSVVVTAGVKYRTISCSGASSNHNNNKTQDYFTLKVSSTTCRHDYKLFFELCV